jgi:hypothetical protein
MRIWLLTKLINLCNYALELKDAPDDHESVNDVVATKNYFIHERDRLIKLQESSR